VGETGLALIVAYGLGHLVQAVGNLIEQVYWRLWGGMPSHWVQSGKHGLLATSQLKLIEDAVPEKLGIKLDSRLQRLPAKEWSAITRQVYAAVSSANLAKRVDVFNGNYGLNRGLAASIAIVVVMLLVNQDPLSWGVLFLLVLGFGVAIYRMHRFGVHYGRELFVQFLMTPAKQEGKKNS